MQKQKTIKIGQNEYSIKFPDNGEMMDIQVLIMRLTKNEYDSLKYSINQLMVEQATKAEAQATFTILIPKLTKDLNATSLSRLEYDQMAEVVRAYEEEYLPWYEELITTFRKPKEEAKKEEDTQSE